MELTYRRTKSLVSEAASELEPTHLSYGLLAAANEANSIYRVVESVAFSDAMHKAAHLLDPHFYVLVVRYHRELDEMIVHQRGTGFSL